MTVLHADSGMQCGKSGIVAKLVISESFWKNFGSFISKEASIHENFAPVPPQEHISTETWASYNARKSSSTNASMSHLFYNILMEVFVVIVVVQTIGPSLIKALVKNIPKLLGFRPSKYLKIYIYLINDVFKINKRNGQ